MKKILVIVLAVALVGGGAYWFVNRNDSDTADDHTHTTNEPHSHEEDETTGVEPTATDKVGITEYSYMPANITVKKGTTVTWTNNDSVAHTVTSSEGSLMDSGDMEKGDTYSVTFNEVGTFDYFCEPHPYMTGSVTVTE